MNTITMEAAEMMVMAPGGLTELVRGEDQQFIERVLPMVQTCDVALNLGTIQRIDAAGVAALISLYGSARNAGHAFAVCNVSAHVEEILRLVGLETILVTHSTMQNRHCGAISLSAA